LVKLSRKRSCGRCRILQLREDARRMFGCSGGASERLLIAFQRDSGMSSEQSGKHFKGPLSAGASSKHEGRSRHVRIGLLHKLAKTQGFVGPVSKGEIRIHLAPRIHDDPDPHAVALIDEMVAIQRTGGPCDVEPTVLQESEG
jgi:hypothetical protein